MNGSTAPIVTTVRALPRSFVLAVAAAGVVLTASVTPGTFTIDESNYLVNAVALRQGYVSLPNTAGLRPSSELAFFDPAAETRAVTFTPVGSTAPPLYAPLALPFVGFGWRGLVALNTLAFLATIALVFVWTRRHARHASTAWLAAFTYAFAGFTIEYAQGVWPHALSVALCTAGLYLIGCFLEDNRLMLVAAGGFLLAMATGIRYQNAVLLVVAGGVVFLWGARRLRAASAFGTAAAVPLVASAFINQARLGSWNPISKGPGYLSIPGVNGNLTPVNLLDPLTMFWARLGDFSVRPPLVGPSFGWVKYEAASGAHLIFGTTVQKAFLQSAPWAILALMMLGAAWFGAMRVPEPRRRQVRLFGLLTMALLMVFAISGPTRHEGASYNQRYLLELVPLAAITFAWALDGIHLRHTEMLAGGLWGALVVVVVLVVVPNGALRHTLVLKLPLLLAAVLGVLWWFARGGKRWHRGVGAMVGMSLGWACALHLFDDVLVSREVRRLRLEQTNILRQVVPDGAALVTYWGFKDAAGPLLLERDIVILDVHADGGASAPALVGELLARGRRVFVLQSGVPPDLMTRLTDGREQVLNPGRGNTIELRASPE